MKYLGIDYGTKRIGLAVSDDDGRVAFPNAVIPVSPSSTDQIAEIIKKEGIQKVVIGESKDFFMNENKIMNDVHKFSDALFAKVPVEMIFHTELFTSSQIATEDHFANTPREQNVRGEKKSENIDARSASLILQGYLDSLK